MKPTKKIGKMSFTAQKEEEEEKTICLKIIKLHT